MGLVAEVRTFKPAIVRLIHPLDHERYVVVFDLDDGRTFTGCVEEHDLDREVKLSDLVTKHKKK